MVKTSLKELQLYCLKHQIPFVSYALPGNKIPVSLFSQTYEVKVYKSIDEIDCNSGFVLSPFQSENCPVIVIPDTLKETGWEVNSIKLFQSLDKSYIQASSIKDQYEISFQKYSAQVDSIKKSLAAGEAKKVVLSRTKVLEGLNYNELPDAFQELVNLYENAFVYFIYTKASGIWLGATPESLLQIDRKNFSTMALAGTQEFASDDGKVVWSDKEIKEHDYVADYVRQKLSIGGYLFHELPRETVCAGNVVHLCTMFDGNIGKEKKAWKELVTLLYPTPAICGTESEATLQLIRKIEMHKREYYTGIIGPFNGEDKTNLFINLRCMKVIDNAAILFAGGGILEESSAVMEWAETEMKFNTLIRVLQKVKEMVRVSG